LERALSDFDVVLVEKSPTLNPRVLGASLRDDAAAVEEVVGARVEKVVVAAIVVVV